MDLAREPYIRDVRLLPVDAEPCLQALSAIESADCVILGPGSWHTSVLPHLLMPEMRQAIRDTEGMKFVTMNLSRDSETQGKTSAQELEILRHYAPDVGIDAVVADPSSVEDREALERAAARMGAIVHFADLRRGEGLSIHSPLKLAAAYQEVMER